MEKAESGKAGRGQSQGKIEAEKKDRAKESTISLTCVRDRFGVPLGSEWGDHIVS